MANPPEASAPTTDDHTPLQFAHRLSMAMATIQCLLDAPSSPKIRQEAEAFVQETAGWLGMEIPE